MPSGQPCYPLNRTRTSLRHFQHDIRLSGIRNVHFLKSEWENFQPENSVSWKYMIYRSIFFLCFIFIIIYNMTCSRGLPYYLLYLTHWSLISQIVYSTLFLIRVIMGYLKFRKDIQRVGTEQDAQGAESQRGINYVPPSSLKLNCLEKAIWILNSVCFVLPLIVTIGFWLFLVRADPKSFRRSKKQACYIYSTSMIHGVNSVLGIIDFFIIAIPVRITHGLYVSFFALVYLTFSGFYEVVGGKYERYYDNNKTICMWRDGTAIYGFLNWKQTPVAAGVASLIACLIGLVFFILAYFLYALRLFIVSIFKPEVYADHYYGLVININERVRSVPSPSTATATSVAAAPEITVTKVAENKDGAGVTFKTPPTKPSAPLLAKKSRSAGLLKVETESEIGDDDEELSVSATTSNVSRSSKRKKDRRKSKMKKPRSKGKVPK